MACETWKEKLDTYLDGELPEEEMRGWNAHLQICVSCSADALARLQMKRSIQAAGKRFTPTADFRRRMQQSIAPKPKRNFHLAWISAAAVVAMFMVGVMISNNTVARNHVYSEIADLHVTTLASASPVDVISTDRHTVKP